MLVRGEGCYDPDPLDLEDFGFLDLDPQKHGDPRIRIQGVKYQPKTAKKNFYPKTQILTFEKREISSFLNDPSSLRIKICEKKLTKN